MDAFRVSREGTYAGSVSPDPDRRGFFLDVAFGPRRRRHRHDQLDLEAAVRAVPRRRLAAVQLHDARGDRETDALTVRPVVAARVDAIERLEDLFGVPLRDARSVIADRDAHFLRVAVEPDLDRLVEPAMRDGVPHDVLDRALQTGRIAEHRGDGRGLEANVGIGVLEAGVVDDLRDDIAQLHGHSLRLGLGAQPGQRHDLADELVEALRFTLDAREVGLRRFTGAPLSERERDGGQNG